MALHRALCLAVVVVGVSAVPRDWAGYRFPDYLQEFEKTYSPLEWPVRAALFAEELAQVLRQNLEYASGRSTWYAAVNNFTDWTEEEFRRVKGKMPHDVKASRHPVTQLLQSTRNPERVDWREKNAVTPVKNQGGCGSCWAFSATETVESHYAIATGKLLELAPQTFVNCVKNPDHCGGSGGCEGATMELAFNLTRDVGMATEADLPYKAHDEQCTTYKPAAKCSGYVKLPVNDADALETAIATVGPVAVTVSANWRRYGGGIFSGACSESSGCTLDHGVVAVGYDNSEGSWLVRNSWGASWGEKGYIRLTRKNDKTVYTDSRPADGVACQPYPKEQKPAGESGVLFDTSYPTGVGAADRVTMV